MTAGSGAARLPGRLAAVPPPRSRRGARRRGRAGLSDGLGGARCPAACRTSDAAAPHL